MNGFLQLLERSSAGHGLRIDYSKEESPGGNGLFYEIGIIGMLEASNTKALDMRLHFNGVIVDWLCRLDCGSIAKTVTMYLDLLSL